jgi:hypothetical protein
MSHSKVPKASKDPKWKIYERAAAEWRDAPFGKLLALPTDGKPITMWGTRDQAMLDVAVGIRRTVEELSSHA